MLRRSYVPHIFTYMHAFTAHLPITERTNSVDHLWRIHWLSFHSLGWSLSAGSCVERLYQARVCRQPLSIVCVCTALNPSVETSVEISSRSCRQLTSSRASTVTTTRASLPLSADTHLFCNFMVGLLFVFRRHSLSISVTPIYCTRLCLARNLAHLLLGIIRSVLIGLWDVTVSC